MARQQGNLTGRQPKRAHRPAQHVRRLMERRKAMLGQLAPRLCLASASACTEAPLAALLQPSRGPRPVAEARRFGISMLVFGFGFSLSKAGHVVRRDRTTARHACECFTVSDRSKGFRAGFRRLDPAMKLWIEAMLDAGLTSAEVSCEPHEG